MESYICKHTGHAESLSRSYRSQILTKQQFFIGTSMEWWIRQPCCIQHRITSAAVIGRNMWVTFCCNIYFRVHRPDTAPTAVNRQKPFPAATAVNARRPDTAVAAKIRLKKCMYKIHLRKQHNTEQNFSNIYKWYPNDILCQRCRYPDA